MNHPIMICGCPGSGTSLVAKMLRHAGLFTGADSGPASARKYHESQSFMQENIRLLKHTIDFPHAPKSADQFRRHNQQMQQQLDQLVKSIDLDRLLTTYWGQADCKTQKRPWCWKDPRNSATAMIWKNVLPGLKVVVVCRKWRWHDRWKRGGTDSGRWYRRQSTREIRAMYEQPLGIEGDDLLKVDVQQLTSDADYFGKVLNWCHLDHDSADRFDDFLDRVGVER